MKKMFLMTIGLLTLSSLSFAEENFVEKFQGVRAKTGNICIVGHQQISYSHPELFISFHSDDNEDFEVTDAGLLETYGLSYKDYYKLLYGKGNFKATANEGSYDYSLEASSNKNIRTVQITGIAHQNPDRKSLGTIILENGELKSVSIKKLGKSLLGRTITKFEDSCSQFEKLK